MLAFRYFYTTNGIAMTLKEISLLRLSRQHVSSNDLVKTRDVVSWMGGMQAQDYSMARWAIGARLPATTQSAVQRSIDKGEIIRTHVIRPTWHFVASSDARWLLELTAPQIKPLLKSRQKELGLTSSTLARSINVLQKALANTKGTQVPLPPNLQAKPQLNLLLFQTF